MGLVVPDPVDGSLINGRPFYRLETSSENSETDAGGMVFDSEGFLYVATNIGVQVCDRQGRVTAVIGAPGESVSAVLSSAGPGLPWLYVTEREQGLEAAYQASWRGAVEW